MLKEMPPIARYLTSALAVIFVIILSVIMYVFFHEEAQAPRDETNEKHLKTLEIKVHVGEPKSETKKILESAERAV